MAWSGNSSHIESFLVKNMWKQGKSEKQKEKKKCFFVTGKKGYQKDAVDDDAMQQQQQIHLPEDIFNLFSF